MSIVWSANFSDAPFEVHQLSMLKDNFAYIIASGGKAIAVDASNGPMLVEELEKHKLKLDAFLLTHHHEDHVAGATYTKKKTDCQIIGPKHETLSFLDQDVEDEEEFSIGPFSFTVLSTPGHCKDHVCFHFKECSLLFCGDAVFLSGCGRIFDSTPEAYFESLNKIKSLPDKTLLFTGHDYFERNAAFARSKEPDNEALANAEYATFRSLEEELPLNPFLRAETVEQFSALREEKNLFDAQWKR